MIEQSNNSIENTAPEDDSSRGLGVSSLTGPTLLDPHRLNDDTRMLSRAIKERWDIPAEKRNILVDRLMDIVEKTSVPVVTKFGLLDVESVADSNAIGAGNLLVKMIGQNQGDEHHEDKIKKPDGGTTINIDNRSVVITPKRRRVVIPDNGRDRVLE